MKDAIEEKENFHRMVTVLQKSKGGYVGGLSSGALAANKAGGFSVKNRCL